MSAAHPWLEPENWPKTPLPRKQLEARIERILTLTNIAYLGTLGKNGPIVSPLEFYADGFDCYVFPQPGSPKLKAMQRDPRICLAVANPMAGWAAAMGCQMFGNAALLEPGTPDWNRGMQVFKWPASAFEIGRKDKEPPKGLLMRLRPDRIVYTEHFLRRDGFAPRQIWLRNG
jgi:hypothetical protein